MKVLLYSGRDVENSSYTGSCTDAVQKSTDSIYGVESHAYMIIEAIMKTKNEGIRINFVQCYKPTSDGETIYFNPVISCSRS